MNQRLLATGCSYQGICEIGLNTSDVRDLARGVARDIPHMSEQRAVEWWGEETPRHTVEVESFLIDACEVTNANFEDFTDRTGYAPESPWRKFAASERQLHPVANASKQDAIRYCSWSSGRRPTEIEWETAASGGTQYRFWSWGDEEDPTKANYTYERETLWVFLKERVSQLLSERKRQEINTVKVGSFAANGYGLHDMIGNVFEWVGAETPMTRGGDWSSIHPAYMRPTSHHGANAPFSISTRFRCAWVVDG